MEKKQWDVVGKVSTNVYVVNVVVSRMDTYEVEECRSFVGADQDDVQATADEYFLEKVKQIVPIDVMRTLRMDMVLQDGFVMYFPRAISMPDPEIITVE